MLLSDVTHYLKKSKTNNHLPQLIIMEPSTLIIAFLSFLSLNLIISYILEYLNNKNVKLNSGKVPSYFSSMIGMDTYKKSINYTLDKSRFTQVQMLWNTVLSLTILFSGILGYIDGYISKLNFGLLSSSVTFIIILTIIPSVINYPFKVYDTFVIEGKYGFNQMTINTFIKDELKGLALSFILGVPFLYGVFFFLNKSGDNWWIYLFIFIFTFQMLLIVVYPVWIAPIFNKFLPLNNEDLKQRLEALATRTKFKTSGIFMMDGSKRSSHSNAYFTGLGKWRRIVLFDTLISQLEASELESVLAHEIGHFKKKHITKMLITNLILMFLGLYALSLAMKWQVMYDAISVEPSAHMGLFLFMTFSSVIMFFFSPLFNVFSRKHEFEADKFAFDTMGEKKSMSAALVKLSEKNLSNLTPHPWYSFFHYSHPTTFERLKALDNL